ncbi:membrane or secreted protein [Flagellimonas nanhaiensis]|uniref:Membrane or secreted protein n=1 Tax=Flagellimonas nanhaiensis TaxID=2292706 RepID=A0A371JQ53_9FLAO|nr:membrane or secreted protein [Allomuricauda nanhaiensis]RDY59645.1 membrane or secreted protein [Allomuricauda nanhaiensis]
MKKLLFVLVFSLPFYLTLSAQDFQGAWESFGSQEDGTKVKYVIIVSGPYFSEAFYEKETGKFMGTFGGSYKTQDSIITYTFEYASFNKELVGTTERASFKFADGKIHAGGMVWTRIDDGTPGKLNGAWLISGRKRDGEIRRRDTSGPRKTMKILSGTRFQWIAYNTETKEFLGTGGGTYTSLDGKYTENIGFFSRDDSRVGASLQFDFDLKEGDWHHSGLSSKGQPIYEIWSKRNTP